MPPPQAVDAKIIERAYLVVPNGPHVAAINGERDRLRRRRRSRRRRCGRRSLQFGADIQGPLAHCLHCGDVVQRQKLRQERSSAAVGKPCAHLRNEPFILRRASVGHDFGGRVQCLADGHGAPAGGEPGSADCHSAEQRHQPPGARIFDRPLRTTPLTAPPAATMIRRLCLDQIVLQSRQDLLSLRQCQSDHPRRIFSRGATAADFVHADGPVRPDELHHDPPLHPALLVHATRSGHTTPTFWTVSGEQADPILETADRLLCVLGIRPTGVDTIATKDQPAM